MYLPPLQAKDDAHVAVSGNVTIHPSAVIAPGVLLQAAPEGHIVIGAGACIGMGAVLHAYAGTIEIQEGASLGAGVLMVGSGTVGTNACVGSSSTILNASVQSHALVPSGTILGDRSRQVAVEPDPEPSKPPVPVATPNPEMQPTVEADPWDNTPPAPEPEITQPIATPNQETTAINPDIDPKAKSTAYGQAYVNDLLSTLLPHRNQQFSPPSS